MHRGDKITEKIDDGKVKRRIGLGSVLCAAVIVGVLLVGTAGAFYMDAGSKASVNPASDQNANSASGDHNNPPPLPPNDTNRSMPPVGHNDTRPPVHKDLWNSSYVLVTPLRVMLDINETMQFTATAYDPKGNEITGLTYTWDVKGMPPKDRNGPAPPKNGTALLIGTVDASGLFTATNNGFGRVVAKTNYTGTIMAGSADVKVGNMTPPPPPPPKPRNCSKILVTPGFAGLNISDTQQFKAAVYDENGTLVTGLTFKWSVKTMPPPLPPPPKGNRTLPPQPNGTMPIIGTIDQNGLFTATADGFGNVVVETDYNGQHIVGIAKIKVGNATMPPPPPDGNGGNNPPPPPDGNGNGMPPPPDGNGRNQPPAPPRPNPP